jgi:putative transposase
LEAEVQEVMKQLRASGADVVRNGSLPERAITTAIGDVNAEVPRIRSRNGKPASFTSLMISKYLRRSSSISA